MYKRLLVSGAAAAMLAGCVSAPNSYGDLSGAPHGYDNAIAADMVTELASDYAPALTRLNIGQPTADAFSATFIASLRDRGFAVAEFGTAARSGDAPRDELRRAVHPFFFHAPRPTQTAVDVRYVLDQLGVDNMYRVTIWLGGITLSRAYIADGGDISPAGAWVRKE
jgi:hypothetical protein